MRSPKPRRLCGVRYRPRPLHAIHSRVHFSADPTYKENGNWRAAVEINYGLKVYIAEEGSKIYGFPGYPKNPEEALQHEMGHVDIWVKFIAEIYLIAERLENMESSSHFVIDFWEAVFKLMASTLFYSDCYPNNVAHDIIK